jgi:hypothetical protein
MKKLLVTFFTIFFCLTLSLSSSADFQKGLTAYQQGNFVMAFNVFKPLAEQGDTSAAFAIAQLYRVGKGVLRDYKKAVKWYRVAAEKIILTVVHGTWTRVQGWVGGVGAQNKNDDR